MPTITATAVRKRNRLGISHALDAAKLTNEIIQHVRRAVASLSGNGNAEGSIGGSETGGIRQSPSCETMSETTSQIAVPTAPEARILGAPGPRLTVLVGLIGAGNPTIGRRHAARLRSPFMD